MRLFITVTLHIRQRRSFGVGKQRCSSFFNCCERGLDETGRITMPPTHAYNQHAHGINPSPFSVRRLIVLFAALAVTIGCGTGYAYSGERVVYVAYMLHLRSPSHVRSFLRLVCPACPRILTILNSVCAATGISGED